MNRVPSLLALQLTLVAPAALGQPLALHFGFGEGPTTVDQRLVLLAQAPSEPELQTRERERVLAVRIEELNQRLGKSDTSWPLRYRIMGWGGGVLAASGLVVGAVLAGYGYTPALTSYVVTGFSLIGAGMLGIVLVAVAIIFARDSTEAVRNERNRLLEEKMRAEAELQYLRGMARPGF